MNASLKATAYANRIKDVLIEMAVKDKLPQDMNELDTKKIQKILSPVFVMLNSLQIDAEMALDGSWDCEGENGKLGFKRQIELINKL